MAGFSKLFHFKGWIKRLWMAKAQMPMRPKMRPKYFFPVEITLKMHGNFFKSYFQRNHVLKKHGRVSLDTPPLSCASFYLVTPTHLSLCVDKLSINWYHYWNWRVWYISFVFKCLNWEYMFFVCRTDGINCNKTAHSRSLYVINMQ